MKSKVDKVEAARLRDDGWTLEQLGQRFGVTRERVRQIVGPRRFDRECESCGENFTTGNAARTCCSKDCASRLSYIRRSGSCRICGTHIGPYSTQCYRCVIAEAKRVRAARFERLRELWDLGIPATEIARRMGWANANVVGVQMARAKHEGWTFTPRRAGWHGHSLPTGVTGAEHTTRRQFYARYAHAVRSGRLVRAPACERCDAEGPVDGHHHDYSKPLDVEWLCRPCHMAEHGKDAIEQAA